MQPSTLASSIRDWGAELGFSRIGIADVDVAQAAERLDAWIAAERHGDMDYLQRHAALRADPSRLLPSARMHAPPVATRPPPAGARDELGAARRSSTMGLPPVAARPPPAGARDELGAARRSSLRVITARMDYLPRDTRDDWAQREFDRTLEPNTAVVSIYARGRDYHKILRERLQKLASRIEAEVGRFGYRVATDSAPVLEVELARKAGLGWRGKHTLLLSQDAGSMYFLGEILTDLPLPVDAPISDHCGTCSRCIDICPTQAITAPYQLDARRCISYLTIEHHGSIPLELRPLIGNRVYGCDDCQLVCPWNKFACKAELPDFDVRNGLDSSTLVELFAWDEAQFDARHSGSAIRRIGHQRWLRNIAVGLGNAPTSPEVIAALRARSNHPSELVREHVAWALARHAALA